MREGEEFVSGLNVREVRRRKPATLRIRPHSEKTRKLFWPAISERQGDPARVPERSRRWAWWPPLLTIAGVLLIAVRGITLGEFSYNVDETQHACTGQFVADLLRDHPFRHPVAYTYLYYVHYPALSGVLHWPPLFYLWEGLVFLLLGSSVVTARLSILVLAAVALWVWFRLVERVESTGAAIVATLLLGLCPSFLLFERTVMLEMPSMLLCLAASFLWIQFLRGGRDRSLIGFAAVAALAMLTKQNAVYLPVFCVLSLTALRHWSLLWRKATVLALGVAVLTAGPYYGFVSLLHWGSIQGDLAEKQSSLLAEFGFYLRALPELLGWPLLMLSLVGLLTCPWWGRRTNHIVFASWALAVYLAMTAIGHKEPRYALYLVPAMIYFALWPVVIDLKVGTARWAAMGMVTVVIATVGVRAWRTQRPYVTGYEAAARGLRTVTDSGIVLLDTKIPANFIFFVRNEDSSRHFVLLRKALYSVRIKEELGGDEYVHTPAQLEQLLRADGIRYLVVSNRAPAAFPVEGVLRTMLKTPQFRRVETFPIAGNSPEWADYSLDLYENLAAGPPSSPYLRTPMMTLDHDIITPFSALGIATASPPPVKH